MYSHIYQCIYFQISLHFHSLIIIVFGSIIIHSMKNQKLIKQRNSFSKWKQLFGC